MKVDTSYREKLVLAFPALCVTIFIALTTVLSTKSSASEGAAEKPATTVGQKTVGQKAVTPEASTAASSLFTITGSGAPTSSGDYISASGALDTFYRFFIEVPAGLSRLQVDIFDADVGIGGAAEATAGRDRARGTFDSSVSYSLVDPSGTARTLLFNSGSATAPTGADNAWLTLFSVTGNNVRDNFGAASYSNNDGNNNWSAAWIETDAGGAGPSSGAIQITGGELRLQDNVSGTPSIQREADLLGTPGLDLTAAFLEFDFRTSNNLEDADQISVEVSNNGGGSWTTLETFSNDSSGSRSYNITTSIANNTRVRFIIAGSFNTADEFFFVDNLRINDGGSPTAGHWELRVDMSSAVTTGDDINALGVRAHDGTSDAGGTELNIYSESITAYGVNPPASGTNTRTYSIYPYITSGCSCSKNDFDYDSDSGNTGSLSFTSNSGAFTRNFASGLLATDDSWRRDTITGWTSDVSSSGYGVWTAAVTINSYLSGGQNGNYTNIYMGNFQAAANPPAANPAANTFRVYLPNDSGAAPVKPRVNQFLTYVSGPNPTLVGQTTRFTINIAVANLSAQAITFSTPTNIVTANIPGGGAVYAGSSSVSQGSIVSQPAVGGTGNITWNPGSLAAGATATLSYNVNVTPTSAGQRIPVTATPASGNGTRAQWLDETGNASQSRATYLFGPLCELAITQGLSPTAVELADFTATSYDGNVILSWQTGYEVDNLGFNIYREVAGKRSRVNSDIIAGSALLAGAGTVLRTGESYFWTDTLSKTDQDAQYWLEDIDLNGASTFSGPFAVSHQANDDGAVSKRERSILLANIAPGDSHSRDVSSTRPVERTAKLSAFEIKPPTNTSDLASGPAVKIAVKHEGFYRVSQPQLLAAGLSAGVNPRFLQLFVDGQELPINVIGELDEFFGPSDSIEFYGLGLDTPSTDSRVYWLVAGQKLGQRINKLQSQGGPGSAGIFLHTVERRDKTVYFPALKNGEADNFFGSTVTSTPVNQTLNLQNVATGDVKDASIEILLQGVTEGAHLVKALLNGIEIGTINFTGQQQGVLQIDLPHSQLVEGDNIVNLVAEGGSTDTSLVQRIRVSYYHTFRADNNSLKLNAQTGQQVTINGFATANIRVLDITDPNAVSEIAGIVDTDKTSFSVTASVTGAGERTLIAIDESQIRQAASVTANEASKLRSSSQGADLVIISHKDFIPSLAQLKALRENQKLSVIVVNVEDIYDEFASGHKIPAGGQGFPSLRKE